MASFLGLEPKYRDPSTAAAAILPVPYDGTSTWKKGADRGPAAVLAASEQVELHDIETASEPYRHGIATLDPILHDGGPEELARQVSVRVEEVLARAQLPIVLGGEHSVSIGAINASAGRYPGLSVLQLDAHADCRETYEGSTHNHACVMARAREVCDIVQVGIRSVDADELATLQRDRVFWAHEIHAAAEPAGWRERAIERLGPDVYVTLDLDVFDPALMPATGTPEPGGLDWYQVLGFLAEVIAARRVVGFDVVELLPTPGMHHCDFLAAKLAYRILAMRWALNERRE